MFLHSQKPELYKLFDYSQEQIYLKCGGVCDYSVNNVRSYTWIDLKKWDYNGTDSVAFCN